MGNKCPNDGSNQIPPAKLNLQNNPTLSQPNDTTKDSHSTLKIQIQINNPNLNA